MHLLTVYAHPFRDRYPAAVMDCFHAPFTQSGATIDGLDLYQEGFDPRFTADDHAHFWGGPILPEIETATTTRCARSWMSASSPTAASTMSRAI